MKKAVVLAAVLFALCLIRAAHAEDLVNLKYLEQEKKPVITCSWDRGEIRIKKGAADIRLYLNYPFLVCGDSQVRLDTPPFTENGGIFIGNYTYETIAEILDNGGVVKSGVNKLTDTTESGVNDNKSPTSELTKVVYAPKPTATMEEEPQELVIVEPAKTPEKKNTPEPVMVQESPPVKKQRMLIVLDPGHGGNDPGAIGPNKLEEKDVVLGIALRVKSYLQKHPVDVLITRDDDTFISLKNRAVFANKKDADLFVSIHCNAAYSREAKGIRTYIYSRVASSKAAAEAAKYENKSAGAFEFLLNDLRKGADEYLSIEAAGNIQHSLIKSLALKWLPTERAPFYVLANTDMPSVLVEAAFISNWAEAGKLNDTNFRDQVARGIADGIMEYLQKIK